MISPMFIYLLPKKLKAGVLTTQATYFINFGLSQKKGTGPFPISRSLERIPTDVFARIEDILCITEGNDDGRFCVR